VNEDQAKARPSCAKGRATSPGGDAKEKAHQSWEEVKDRLDDLGDELVEMMARTASRSAHAALSVSL
jgi:hypothetical protein